MKKIIILAVALLGAVQIEAQRPTIMLTKLANDAIVRNDVGEVERITFADTTYALSGDGHRILVDEEEYAVPVVNRLGGRVRSCVEHMHEHEEAILLPDDAEQCGCRLSLSEYAVLNTVFRSQIPGRADLTVDERNSGLRVSVHIRHRGIAEPERRSRRVRRSLCHRRIRGSVRTVGCLCAGTQRNREQQRKYCAQQRLGHCRKR